MEKIFSINFYQIAINSMRKKDVGQQNCYFTDIQELMHELLGDQKVITRDYIYGTTRKNITLEIIEYTNECIFAKYILTKKLEKNPLKTYTQKDNEDNFIPLDNEIYSSDFSYFYFDLKKRNIALINNISSISIKTLFEALNPSFKQCYTLNSYFDKALINMLEKGKLSKLSISGLVFDTPQYTSAIINPTTELQEIIDNLSLSIKLKPKCNNRVKNLIENIIKEKTTSNIKIHSEIDPFNELLIDFAENAFTLKKKIALKENEDTNLTYIKHLLITSMRENLR